MHVGLRQPAGPPAEGAEGEGRVSATCSSFWLKLVAAAAASAAAAVLVACEGTEGAVGGRGD